MALWAPFLLRPCGAGQLVLMDYRTEHLSPQEQTAPPTFLYAMDLGGGRYFVEETSLAHAPALSFELLEQRLHQRLAWLGVQVGAVEHIERCLFPMNLPLPDLTQPVLGYGGAASMVHPASGYQVGAALRRAKPVAQAIAAALRSLDASPAQVAQAGWQALWPAAEVRKRALYLFGLQSLLRFDSQGLSEFFAAFFQLPAPLWHGYLSNTLATPEVLDTMARLFGQASNRVRGTLLRSAGPGAGLLLRAFLGR